MALKQNGDKATLSDEDLVWKVDKSASRSVIHTLGIQASPLGRKFFDSSQTPPDDSIKESNTRLGMNSSRVPKTRPKRVHPMQYISM